jgi:hypothetical protein
MVERQVRDLDFPVVRFQGPKDTWAAHVRAFNFGEAIGVMNYWWSRTCAQLLAVRHSIAFDRGGHRPAPVVLARLACYLLNCPRTAPAGKTVLWTLT